MSKKRRSEAGESPAAGPGPPTSRRKFLRRLAYVPPAILTFVASRANAQAGTCKPADCRPVTCKPADCSPGPCPPQACKPAN